MELHLALPPQNNEAFLREVDEELRRDQLLTLWRRRGRWIVAGVVVALLAFAAFLYWRHSNTSNAGTEGEALNAALRDFGENRAAQGEAAIAKLADSGNAGYRAAARFTQASLLLEKDNRKGAAAKFGEIAADASMPQQFRDLALIRQTAAEFDTLKPEVAIQRMAPLATKESPWLGSAGEMLAIAYLRQGKRADAARVFSMVAQGDKAVPDSIRQRAVQMAGVLGVDAAPQTEEKKAQ